MSNEKPLTYQKSFKYEFFPTEEQKAYLAKTFGCCRYVYNHFLEKHTKDYDDYKIAAVLSPNLPSPKISFFQDCLDLTALKRLEATSFLGEASIVALQQSLKDLEEAYKAFFKRNSKGVGYPRFKSRHKRQSFRLQKEKFFVDATTGLFTIPKLTTPLKTAYHRPLPSEPSRATISLLPCGKYFVSFLCEVIPQKTTGTGKIGIDLGIKDFAVLSDGSKIPNPKCFDKARKNLKRKQQALSRKQKGSKNRAKARLAVAKIHYHIAQQRYDFHHKLSTKLVNENQVICLESLRVKNMVKNRKLSRVISDAGWSRFVNMLQYKAAFSQHTTIAQIGTYFPSTHTCHVDGVKLDRKLSLSERSWTCPSCGTLHDRDINAAKVIEQMGLYLLDKRTGGKPGPGLSLSLR